MILVPFIMVPINGTIILTTNMDHISILHPPTIVVLLVATIIILVVVIMTTTARLLPLRNHPIIPIITPIMVPHMSMTTIILNMFPILLSWTMRRRRLSWSP
jgi:hypothetical protein